VARGHAPFPAGGTTTGLLKIAPKLIEVVQVPILIVISLDPEGLKTGRAGQPWQACATRRR